MFRFLRRPRRVLNYLKQFARSDQKIKVFFKRRKKRGLRSGEPRFYDLVGEYRESQLECVERKAAVSACAESRDIIAAAREKVDVGLVGNAKGGEPPDQEF